MSHLFLSRSCHTQNLAPDQNSITSQGEKDGWTDDEALCSPLPPDSAQTLRSRDALQSDAASLFKFKYIPVDTKCEFSSDLASMLHLLSELDIAFLKSLSKKNMQLG